MAGGYRIIQQRQEAFHLHRKFYGALLLYINENKLITAVIYKTGEFHKGYNEQNKPDSKEYILHASIYPMFKH